MASDDRLKTVQWRRLHVLDGAGIRDLWNVPMRSDVDDPLLQNELCLRHQSLPPDSDESRFSWAVGDARQLARLLGAFQYHNPRCSLWFRGESIFHVSATPKAFRDLESGDEFVRGKDWLRMCSGRHSLLRDRSEIAKWAILQHYGVATPLLDVTRSPWVALAFALSAPVITGAEVAWERSTAPEPHISIFATPRVQDGFNIFLDAGICAVDLAAELPSHCLRPHTQEAAFQRH